MGKAEKCIRLLQILNTGGVYKISELADLLETNPRNVIEYKKELDEVAAFYGSGFYIENVLGRYGGYKLNGNASIPPIKLTPSEKNTLVESCKYLISNPGYVNKNEVIKVYSKIMSNLLIEDKNLELLAANKINVYKNISKIQEWYEVIQLAIKQKKALLIEYDFLKEPRHIVKVHPYQLFIYDNEWRFIGLSVEAQDIFYYKLSRIIDIKRTDERFTVWKNFKIENYIRDGVFTQNGEMFPVTLIASGIRAKLFKEKEYGKNQVCEDLPDGRVKITLEMQKNHSTYNFILGCGDLVEVVEPEWLKDKVVELASNILKKYNK